MTERKKYPRYLNLPGWTVDIVSVATFTQEGQIIGNILGPNGENVYIVTDTVHHQIVYMKSNGEVLRRKNLPKNRMSPEQVEQINTDPSAQETGPYSRWLKADAYRFVKKNGGDLESTDKSEYPQSFKFKR